MPVPPTVLSYLAKKFATHPENIATEALGFILSASLGPSALAICRWRVLLAHLNTTVELAGDSARSADIRQLASLCDEMDSDAFLPLRSDEITSTIGRRIIQFGDLASDIVDALVTSNLANVVGLTKTSRNGRHGRYLRLNECGCFLGFDALMPTFRTRTARFSYFPSSKNTKHIMALVSEES